MVGVNAYSGGSMSNIDHADLFFILTTLADKEENGVLK
jgi:hypothetical protein